MTNSVIPAKTRVPSMEGLERSRLSALLRATWDHPLTLVVAPAGAGKTTLLSSFARQVISSGRRLAWYQAGSSESNPAALLRHLEEALGQALPGLAAGWQTVGEAVAALEAWGGEPVALIVDDAHTLAGTDAEETLTQLICYVPPKVHVVVSSRRPPTIDLSRWRLAEQLTEIGPDDLRFRSWEVEELFVQYYHQRLRPDDLAELARRTEGWAAGLALFHLATRHKTPAERRRVLDSLSSQQRDTRAYLTGNVLAELDDDRRDFLIRTCVLGRLSGPWCDTLLDRHDSAAVLAELQQRHLFLVSDDSGVTYRQHDVVRAHLEELLVERIGESATQELYHRAGPILEEGGAEAEALRAYCRAQDWVAADRLLGRSGDRVFDPFGAWVEPLPAALTDHDGWLLLAVARRQVRSGHWTAALGSYGQAEKAAVGELLARTCQEERFRLSGWTGPLGTAPHTAGARFRRALAGDPLGAVRELEQAMAAAEDSMATGPELVGKPKLAAGFSLLAAGHLRRAATVLSTAADELDQDSVLARWGAFVGAGLRRFLGDPANDLGGALEAVDAVAPPWLGRLLRQLVDGPSATLVDQIRSARTDAATTDNPWIDLGLLLLQGFGHMETGRDDLVASFDQAALAATTLEAPVIAAWAASFAALVQARRDPCVALTRAVAAEDLARSVECPGALALALLVAARVEGSPLWARAARPAEDAGVVPLAPLVTRFLAGGLASRDPADHLPEQATDSGDATTSEPSPTAQTSPKAQTSSTAQASSTDEASPIPGATVRSGGQAGTGAELGLQRDGDARRAPPVVRAALTLPAPDIEIAGADGPPLVEVRCLGSFSLTVDGAPVDVGTAKPRLRGLLYRMALDTGHPVHRDQLRSALWPRDDERTGTRNLQVAISALRQFLEGLGKPGAGAMIARRGDAYLLDPGAGGSDLRVFEEEVELGRRARRRGEREAAVSSLRAALALYGGDLLADEGLAEWILDERERFRLLAADSAQILAECLLEGGDVTATVEVAERGVWIDRYNDRLWRVLIEAHERSGNLAAAARCGRQYTAVLDELGVAGALAAEH